MQRVSTVIEETETTHLSFLSKSTAMLDELSQNSVTSKQYVALIPKVTLLTIPKVILPTKHLFCRELEFCSTKLQNLHPQKIHSPLTVFKIKFKQASSFLKDHLSLLHCCYIAELRSSHSPACYKNRLPEGHPSPCLTFLFTLAGIVPAKAI